MNKLKRYIVFLIGLFINSLGVSLITKASLGTSPISSIPYVLSLSFPFSLGQFTIAFSLLLILIQLFILRKNFKLEHLLQIPISIIFGYFIDLTMVLLSFIEPTSYISCLIYLFIGCLVLGIGVYTEVLADVAMLPGESYVRAVSTTWKTDFGTTKVCFDVSISCIAAIASLILEHHLNGVREGTIIAAILVGFIARLIGRKLSFLSDILFSEHKEAQPTNTNDTTLSPVIVIERQYGSGGHQIGQTLAKQLNYAFYDNEIIKMAATTSGIASDFIQRNEENIANGLLSDFKNQMYVTESPQDEIFESETKVIQDIAQKGNCVIVGRCADYVLKNRPNTLKLFLHAPVDYRKQRLINIEHVPEHEVMLKMSKVDKHRKEYYNYYTKQLWGNAQNYTLSLDTSIGIDKTISIITNILQTL